MSSHTFEKDERNFRRSASRRTRNVRERQCVQPSALRSSPLSCSSSNLSLAAYPQGIRRRRTRIAARVGAVTLFDDGRPVSMRPSEAIINMRALKITTYRNSHRTSRQLLGTTYQLESLFCSAELLD